MAFDQALLPMRVWLARLEFSECLALSVSVTFFVGHIGINILRNLRH